MTLYMSSVVLARFCSEFLMMFAPLISRWASVFMGCFVLISMQSYLFSTTYANFYGFFCGLFDHNIGLFAHSYMFIIYVKLP